MSRTNNQVTWGDVLVMALFMWLVLPFIAGCVIANPSYRRRSFDPLRPCEITNRYRYLMPAYNAGCWFGEFMLVEDLK